MVTRVTFIEFTPARGGLLYLIKADVYSYVHSIPFPRAYPDPASLSSYRWASVALFTYYWCAACRQQAIEIPSLSIGHLPSLSLSPSFSAKGETRSRYPLWQKFQYGTPRTVPRGFDVRYFRILSNKIAELHGTKYARNITGGSNATVGDVPGEASTMLLCRYGRKIDRFTLIVIDVC